MEGNWLLSEMTKWIEERNFDFEVEKKKLKRKRGNENGRNTGRERIFVTENFTLQFMRWMRCQLNKVLKRRRME